MGAFAAGEGLGSSEGEDDVVDEVKALSNVLFPLFVYP